MEIERGQETASSGLGLTEEDGEAITRKCSKCHKTQPTEEYRVITKYSPRRDRQCKSCKADYDKIYRKKHRKLHTAQHKAWRYKKRIKELTDELQ